jgi:hypothetical protein
MIRPICSQLRTQLQEIKSLKGDFDLELPKIKDTRNTASALALETEMREKIKFIKDALFFAQFDHVEWAQTTIGGKSKEELIKELEDREESNNPEDKIYISSYARSMLQKPEFTVINKPAKITLIRLKIQDLGFRYSPTADQLYSRAKKLGLELCPPEIGPHLRLNYQEVFRREQPKDEYLFIGMKKIVDSYGNLRVFHVCHNDDDLRELDSRWTEPEHKWFLASEFVFARK